MYDMHSNGKVELLVSRARVLGFRAATSSASMLAIVFNMEVVKTEAIFWLFGLRILS